MTGDALAGCVIAGGSADRITLRVLGTFDLTVDGASVALGITAQRLLTLVALRSGRMPRTLAASILWPTARTARAAANLRSTLWRLQQSAHDVIDTSCYDLRLAQGVGVDLHQVSSVAFGLVDQAQRLDAGQLSTAMRCNLYDDITPDVGDEEWLVTERERFRQLRVHALEALAARLIAAGWHGAAIEATLGAIRADPFRESAYRWLITAHLAEGNRFEAHRQHRAYRELVRAELGLAPSAEFMALLHENPPSYRRRGAG